MEMCNNFFDENNTAILDNVNERVSEDVNKLFGFDKELEELIKCLLKLKKSNVLILGKPGVGKTALVEKLAQKINSGNVPKELRYKTIYELSLNSALAGTRYRGDFEKKIDDLLTTIMDNGDIILFVDEIHNLVNCGDVNNNKSSMSFGETLKPYLARNQIQLIGATTMGEYKKYIKNDPAFDRRFSKIIIDEPDMLDVIGMLEINKEQYEKHYDVKLTMNDLTTIVKKAKRKKGVFPDKAFDELEDYCYDLKSKQNEE